MTIDIGENFLLDGTAKDIWEAAKEIYSSRGNTTVLSKIEGILHDLRQGNMEVNILTNSQGIGSNQMFF